MATPVKFLIDPLPNAVAQGNTNLCWLAATAVMDSYKAKKSVTMGEASARLGGEYVLKQAQGIALQFSELDAWLAAGGFNKEQQLCFGAEGWEKLLKAHGPLITLVDGSNDARAAIDHAVVVVGIDGDGTEGGTNISYADGQTATVESRTLSAFATRFELPSGTNTAFSVGYFKP